MSKKYSVELKMQAVKMYLDEGISSTRIAKELKLSTHHRVMLAFLTLLNIFLT